MKFQQPGPKPTSSAKPTSKSKRRTSHGRTSRACDRCRVKKAKCNGVQPCKTCRTSDSPCIYSIRRRDARSYYYQMREVTDNALQRLYWASRRRSGFPGQAPDESTGIITTTDILKGLSLIKPEFDEFELTKEIGQIVYADNGTDPVKHPLQAVTPRDPGEFDNIQSVLSSYSFISSPQLSNEQVATSQISKSELATLSEEIEMKEQFLAHSHGTKSSRKDRRRKSPDEDRQQLLFCQTESATESHRMDVDAFLDMSFCTPPSICSQSSYNNFQLMPSNMPSLSTPRSSHVKAHQSPPGLIYDSYLLPWSGSFAEAHQPMAI